MLLPSRWSRIPVPVFVYVLCLLGWSTLLLPCLSQVTRNEHEHEHELFLISGTYSANVYKSSIQRWKISDDLKLFVSDNMNGEVLIAAALEVDIAKETYWKSGKSFLGVRIAPHDTRNGNMVTSPTEVEEYTLNCVFMSVTGADGKFNDDPNTINIAAACPITSTLSKYLSPNSFSLATAFSSTHQLSLTTLSLEPQCTVESENEVRVPKVQCPSTLTASVPVAFFQSPARLDSLSLAPVSDQTLQKSKHAVATIQTFKNRFTGPMLYMFARHYLRLGYAVIIFDRFSDHKEVFKDFEGPSFSNFHYYGFTVFEKMFPHIYNSTYHATKSEKFLHFHHFEPKKDKRSYVKGRDTQNQNSDKRKTYNLARHLHSEYDAMFYIDRDELLYCPPSGENEENTSLNIQANTQREVIDHYISGGYEQLSFQRYAYASRLPPGFNDSLSENVRADLMDNWLPDCLEKGYAARSMSALWKCWGKHYEKQRQFKSGDIRLGKVCPFVGLHEMCLRCSCNKLHETRKRSSLKGSSCHFMHLNSVHVKAWMNPRKWHDSINDVNTPQVDIWRQEESHRAL